MESQIERKKTGNHFLNIEKAGTRFVVRLDNGFAICLGVTKKGLEPLLNDVKNGKYDEYIKNYCK